MLIPNSASSVFIADHATSHHLLSSPICLPDTFLKYENLYLKLEKEDNSRWMMMSSESMVIRESDLMPNQQRLHSNVFQQCYAPLGLYYALQLTLAYNDVFLGLVSLYRTREQGDFTDEEMFYLRSLNRHLSLRYYRHLYEENNQKPSGSSTTSLAVKYHLTNREVDVLKLIFEEKNNTEITEELCISIHTLKKHIQSLYAKFGVSTRWELLSFR